MLFPSFYWFFFCSFSCRAVRHFLWRNSLRRLRILVVDIKRFADSLTSLNDSTSKWLASAGPENNKWHNSLPAPYIVGLSKSCIRCTYIDMLSQSPGTMAFNRWSQRLIEVSKTHLEHNERINLSQQNLKWQAYLHQKCCVVIFLRTISKDIKQQLLLILLENFFLCYACYIWCII